MTRLLLQWQSYGSAIDRKIQNDIKRIVDEWLKVELGRWWQEVCAKEMQFYENEYGRRSLLSRRRNIIAFTHTTINARVVYIIIINIMKIQFVHAEEKWLKFVVHLSQGDQQSVSQTGLARRRLRRRTATSGCVLGLLRVIQSRYLFASLGAFSPRDSRFNVVGTARCVYRFLGRGRQSFSQSGRRKGYMAGQQQPCRVVLLLDMTEEEDRGIDWSTSIDKFYWMMQLVLCCYTSASGTVVRGGDTHSILSRA